MDERENRENRRYDFSKNLLWIQDHTNRESSDSCQPDRSFRIRLDLCTLNQKFEDHYIAKNLRLSYIDRLSKMNI